MKCKDCPAINQHWLEVYHQYLCCCPGKRASVGVNPEREKCLWEEWEELEEQEKGDN